MSGRPFFAGLITLILTAGALLSARAQTGSVSLEAYWETLDELRQALRDDAGGTPPADLAMRIRGIAAVELPDGTHLPVDHAFLTALLESDPPQTDRVLAVLDQVFAYRDAQGPDRFTPDDLDRLAAILSGPEYAWPEETSPNPLAELWQRFLNWTARLLARLTAGAGLGVVANTVLIAAIALFLGLILRFVYAHSVRGIIREAETGAETEIPSSLTADRAFDQARRRSEAGDLREAVRFLYLAALLVLEDRGHIRLDRAHTNRELLIDLAPRPEIADRFKKVIETFDRVWYGFQPISREEFGSYDDAVTELQSRLFKN